MDRVLSFFRASPTHSGSPSQEVSALTLGAVILGPLRRVLAGLSLVALALALFLGSAGLTPAMAQEGSGSGQVQRIDAPNKKITLKHGAIADLDLPAMTLVYLIEPVLLEGIAPGDNVRFTARRNDQGQYLIIQIRKR